MRIADYCNIGHVQKWPLVEMTSKDLRIIDESLALYQRTIDELHLTDTVIGRAEYDHAQTVRDGLSSIMVSVKLLEENGRKEEPAHV